MCLWDYIGSDNGLLPVKYHAITWINADIGNWTNISEIWIMMQKIESVVENVTKWQPFCSQANKLILLFISKHSTDYRANRYKLIQSWD